MEEENWFIQPRIMKQLMKIIKEEIMKVPHLKKT